MPRLPNEILDQIWLERCKLGFEPCILQPKWVSNGRFHVPAFYAAQSQAFMTQLCHGARAVAAEGFYSRISDNPLTGLGGFWWHEKDVLYVDQDFYYELRTRRKAVFMGQDYITRVALDTQIDADATAVTELLLEWFPKLSQVFHLCSARLTPTSSFRPRGYTIWPFRRTRQPGPLVSESASTKSFPIITFCKMKPRVVISGDLFIRSQGLGAKVRKKRLFLSDRFLRGEKVPFFVFERDDRPQVVSAGGSLSEDQGRCPYNLGHVLVL